MSLDGINVPEESAKFLQRSHDAVIRVYGEAGKVIETPRARGRFKSTISGAKQKAATR